LYASTQEDGGSGDDEGDERKTGTGTTLTGEEVQKAEAEWFQVWLKGVYAKYPRETLNHFEHNLNVWRQLWHVMLGSNVIALLADVRNPLYHIYPTWYRHIVERLHKRLVVVLTKVRRAYF